MQTKKVKLVAMAYFTYDKRNLVPGDSFEAIEKDSALLKHIGRATMAAEDPEPEAEPETTAKVDPKQQLRQTQRYPHRSMKADD